MDLALQLGKLGVSYFLFAAQSRSFALHRYFGGAERNGLIAVAAAFFLTPKVLATLPLFVRVLVR